MRIAGVRYPVDTVLLAAIVDRLSVLVWRQTRDGEKGRNMPASVAKLLTEDPRSRVRGFNTPEEFEKRRREILNGN